MRAWILGASKEIGARSLLAAIEHSPGHKRHKRFCEHVLTEALCASNVTLARVAV